MRALRGASVLLFACCALVLAGCHEDPPPPTPGSFLDTLRVLGVKADPPEITPNDQSILTTLVYDPKLYPDQMVAIWVFCEPSPTSTLGTKCADAQTARDPSSIISSLFSQSDPAIQIRLFDRMKTSYRPSDQLRTMFNRMSDIDRQRGVSVDVVLLVFESTDLTEVMLDLNSREPSIPSVFTLKTLRVAEPAGQANTNPTIEAFRVQGRETEANETVLQPGLKRIELSVLPSQDSLQTFTRYLPDGTVLQQQEELSVSWFTTIGSFEEGNEAAARTSGANPIHLLLDPSVPRQSAAEVYAVMRDGRGGTDWAVRTIKVSP